MKVLLPVILAVLVSAFLIYQPVSAAESASSGMETICLPGIYLVDPDDCLPLGPSSYLTRMASSGIIFPLSGLPGIAPDLSLNELPYRYARLKESSTPVYATLNDALEESSPVMMIESGDLKFISYIETVEQNSRLVFHLKSGGWVLADSVSTRISVKRFQGLVFKQTPKNSFGWILPLNPTIETKRTPGYQNQDYTGRVLTEYDLVQIYSVQRVGEGDWYQVNPHEWVEQRLIGRVNPDPTPPEGVTNGRWIEINLFEQTLAVYDQHRLVYATLIATGLDPFFTRPGLFPVYKKHTSTPMRGAFEADRSDFYYLEDVPWTLYYDEARAIHGAYWRTRFGFPQSHGCVNLSPGDARWVYEWAEEGDWVYVWDPSGRTPTDPAAYTPGGA